MADVERRRSTAGHPARRTFFGEPRALAYLAFTEAWERFSYYGMTALLVLYMSEALLLPGRIEHVVGFEATRFALEAIFGPMTRISMASMIFGIYTGLVYATPILGGWMADRWISRHTAVVAGAFLMTAGHIAMAFDASFLLALMLLVIGCGLLKGNISTQVGGLYTREDSQGRTRGFAIFSTAINVGAVAGPLGCGLLADLYGWHAGFGLAGLLMLLGLATYLTGHRVIVEESRNQKRAGPASPESTQGRRSTVLALLAVMAITIFQSIAYYQCGDIALIWINRDVDLNLLGFRVPVAWFNSIDSLVSIVSAPVLLYVWRPKESRRCESDEIKKIGIGAWITCAANLVLVVACLFSRKVSVLAPILYLVLLGIGFIYYWPTLLALTSRVAPPAIQATMMGVSFMTQALANLIIGALGGLFERMSAASFWSLHAAIAAIGGILALLGSRRLSSALRGDRPPAS